MPQAYMPQQGQQYGHTQQYAGPGYFIGPTLAAPPQYVQGEHAHTAQVPPSLVRQQADDHPPPPHTPTPADTEGTASGLLARLSAIMNRAQMTEWYRNASPEQLAELESDGPADPRLFGMDKWPEQSPGNVDTSVVEAGHQPQRNESESPESPTASPNRADLGVKLLSMVEKLDARSTNLVEQHVQVAHILQSMQNDKGQPRVNGRPQEFKLPRVFERRLQDTERDKIRLTLQVAMWQIEMQTFEQHIQLVHPSLTAVLLDNDYEWQQKLAARP